MAQEAKVTSLMSKELAQNPGKEVLMITVEYPPGSVDPIHRHNAQAFVYVLEGSIVMQVRGGKEVTLTPGQTFYEGPDDVHVVGRNASLTKPAKFLVVLIKDKGAGARARRVTAGEKGSRPRAGRGQSCDRNGIRGVMDRPAGLGVLSSAQAVPAANGFHFSLDITT